MISFFPAAVHNILKLTTVTATQADSIFFISGSGQAIATVSAKQASETFSGQHGQQRADGVMPEIVMADAFTRVPPSIDSSINSHKKRTNKADDAIRHKQAPADKETVHDRCL